jgi:hypothetical protein
LEFCIECGEVSVSLSDSVQFAAGGSGFIRVSIGLMEYIQYIVVIGQAAGSMADIGLYEFI